MHQTLKFLFLSFFFKANSDVYLLMCCVNEAIQLGMDRDPDSLCLD